MKKFKLEDSSDEEWNSKILRKDTQIIIKFKP